jgi:hypothetical protein
MPTMSAVIMTAVSAAPRMPPPRRKIREDSLRFTVALGSQRPLGGGWENAVNAAPARLREIDRQKGLRSRRRPAILRAGVRDRLSLGAFLLPSEPGRLGARESTASNRDGVYAIFRVSGSSTEE